MNYLLQSKKRNKRRFIPIIIILAVIGIALLLGNIAPSLFPAVSHSIGRPLWKTGDFLLAQTGDLRAFIYSRKRLIEMNKGLQTELESAKERLLAQSILERENTELKESWGRKTEVKSVLAAVLVKPPQTLYDTLILDAGEEHGIAVGSSVVLSDTILLGTIDEVFGKTARAKLFSSVDTETQAVIDRNNISVTLHGKGGGNFEIKLPQEVDVMKDDIITMPGMKPSTIATVVEIESNPTNSFKRVLCKTPVNIAELRWVSVNQ